MTKYQELLSGRTNEELIRDWMILDTQKITSEIATVRGWLMDEIEKRFPGEFNNWIENCDKDDNLEHYIKLA
jgi:hypothetical protein